jgi:trimeric autotransporter adhesin
MLLHAAQHGGTVRAADQPVPGATVTATMGDKKLTTTTGEDGTYSFRDLPTGVWLIEVEMFGFARQGQPLLVNADSTSFDWSLELKSRLAKATAAPPPVVASATQAPPTPPPSVPKTVTPAPLQRPALHPSGESGFVTLALNAETEEAAGAPPPPPPPADDAGPSEAFLVTGSMSRGLEDARKQEERGYGDIESSRSSRGLSMGSDGMGGFGGIGPIPTKGMSSGKSSSGSVRSSSGSSSKGRRGSSKNSRTSIGNRRQQNDIRGSAYTSLRNSALDARSYSLTGQPTPKPSYAQSRFGVSAGGALRIPKVFEPEGTFFYFTYTGSHTRSPYNTTSTLPSALERSGDFSQSVARGPVTIYDPLSQLPFSGNRIPQDRINPTALGLLSFMPAATYSRSVQNYQFLTSVPNVSDSYGFRLNQTLSRHDRLDFNMNFQTRDSQSSTAYGFRDNGNGNGLSSSAGYTHNFGPKFTNNVRWSFSRNLSKNTPYFAYGTDVARQLGISGTSTDPRNFGPPNLSFTNFGGLSDTTPSVSRSQTSTIADGIVFVKKKHNLSFGGDYRRMQRNSYSENGRGGFSFSGIETSAFDNGQPIGGTGFDFADFLLGLPQSSSIRFGAANTYFRAQEYNAYASDDFRLRPNFTIVAGLRYEYFTPFTEKYGRIANLDIAPGFTGVAVVTPGQSGPYTGDFPDALVNPNKKLLSPRAGIGWKPNKKRALVVRAGYGLFFVGSTYSQFTSRLASQPPFATTASLTTSTARQLTLENGFAAAPKQNVTNTYAVDKNYRVPYVQNWNLSIQQTLKHGFFVQAGYMGNKGTRLDLQLMPNRAMPGSPLTAEQRRLIGNATGFTYDTSVGNSIYHAANLQLQRRFQKGVSFTANYTLAKAIDNASSFGGGIVQDAYNLRAERGLSSFDQRHVLSLGWYLLSPVGEHGVLKNGNWSKRLLGNWSLSGTTSYNSGTPYTARVLGNLSNSGGNVGSGRADATGADVTAGPGFFNPLAYTIPPSGRFGNSGRNTIPGLPRASLNLGVGRSFSLSGDNRRRIEFRVDAGNITNHVNYTSLGTVVNASNYGLPLATAGMRSVNGTLRFRF